MEHNNFFLEILKGRHKGQTFCLSANSITLGRRLAPKEKKKDWILLDEPSMARIHALLQWDEEKSLFKIVQKASGKVILVNNKKEKEALLYHLDTFLLGDVLFRMWDGPVDKSMDFTDEESAGIDEDFEEPRQMPPQESDSSFEHSDMMKTVMLQPEPGVKQEKPAPGGKLLGSSDASEKVKTFSFFQKQSQKEPEPEAQIDRQSSAQTVKVDFKPVDLFKTSLANKSNNIDAGLDFQPINLAKPYVSQTLSSKVPQANIVQESKPVSRDSSEFQPMDLFAKVRAKQSVSNLNNLSSVKKGDDKESEQSPLSAFFSKEKRIAHATPETLDSAMVNLQAMDAVKDEAEEAPDITDAGAGEKQEEERKSLHSVARTPVSRFSRESRLLSVFGKQTAVAAMSASSGIMRARDDEVPKHNVSFSSKPASPGLEDSGVLLPNTSLAEKKPSGGPEPLVNESSFDDFHAIPEIESAIMDSDPSFKQFPSANIDFNSFEVQDIKRSENFVNVPEPVKAFQPSVASESFESKDLNQTYSGVFYSQTKRLPPVKPKTQRPMRLQLPALNDFGKAQPQVQRPHSDELQSSSVPKNNMNITGKSQNKENVKMRSFNTGADVQAADSGISGSSPQFQGSLPGATVNAGSGPGGISGSHPPSQGSLSGTGGNPAAANSVGDSGGISGSHPQSAPQTSQSAAWSKPGAVAPEFDSGISGSPPQPQGSLPGAWGNQTVVNAGSESGSLSGSRPQFPSQNSQSAAWSKPGAVAPEFDSGSRPRPLTQSPSQSSLPGAWGNPAAANSVGDSGGISGSRPPSQGSLPGAWRNPAAANTGSESGGISGSGSGSRTRPQSPSMSQTSQSAAWSKPGAVAPEFDSGVYGSRSSSPHSSQFEAAPQADDLDSIDPNILLNGFDISALPDFDDIVLPEPPPGYTGAQPVNQEVTEPEKVADIHKRSPFGRPLQGQQAEQDDLVFFKDSRTGAEFSYSLGDNSLDTGSVAQLNRPSGGLANNAFVPSGGIYNTESFIKPANFGLDDMSSPLQPGQKSPEAFSGILGNFMNAAESPSSGSLWENAPSGSLADLMVTAKNQSAGMDFSKDEEKELSQDVMQSFADKIKKYKESQQPDYSAPSGGLMQGGGFSQQAVPPGGLMQGGGFSQQAAPSGGLMQSGGFSQQAAPSGGLMQSGGFNQQAVPSGGLDAKPGLNFNTRFAAASGVGHNEEQIDSAKWSLNFIKSPGGKKTFNVNADEVLIGRSKGIDLSLDDLQLAERHIKLYIYDGKLYLQKLDRNKPVFLNGNPLISAAGRLLAQGDKVQLSDSTVFEVIRD